MLRRWPGEGSLRILDVQLQDPSGEERAVFRVGTPMTLSIRYRAEQTRVFPLVHVAAMYRVDGIKVSQHASAREEVDLAVGREREARLEFAPLNLADGRYVLSVALYRSLDPTLIDEPQVYDLIDRSYEFEVVGNPPLRTSLFVLPARWRTSELSYQDVKEGASDG